MKGVLGINWMRVWLPEAEGAVGTLPIALAGKLERTLSMMQTIPYPFC